MKCIDLFAGAGGFTTGAEKAGAEVLWAANHWPVAVETHRANHPKTAHACQDLHQARWETVPAHDVLLASPCCQGHSRARGGERPGSDTSRSTAWAVVSCAEYHRPPVVVVENVPEFRDWTLYPAWRLAMHAMGYSIAEHVIDAADAGVPQERVRLFLVCTRSTVPLDLGAPREAHVPVDGVLRFDESVRWSPIDKPGRAPKTLARVAAGRARFGERFVMPYYGSGSGMTGRSIDRPLGTLTTLARWAVVDGERMRMLSVDEARAVMGFPAGYVLPTNQRDAHMCIGNAVCPPVAEWVVGRLMEVG